MTKLDIIIPVYNEDENIIKLLKLLDSQVNCDFRVLICYDSESDTTLKHLKNSNITILDSKTKLQEYSLKKYKRLPSYQFISSRGPRHNPTFKVSVSITESKIFYGTGKSIQKAEQDGAYKLLKGTKLS